MWSEWSQLSLLIHLVNLQNKAFSIGLKTALDSTLISFHLAVTQQAVNCCRLLFKTLETDEEEYRK